METLLLERDRFRGRVTIYPRRMQFDHRLRATGKYDFIIQIGYGLRETEIINAIIDICCSLTSYHKLAQGLASSRLIDSIL